MSREPLIKNQQCFDALVDKLMSVYQNAPKKLQIALNTHSCHHNAPCITLPISDGNEVLEASHLVAKAFGDDRVSYTISGKRCLYIWDDAYRSYATALKNAIESRKQSEPETPKVPVKRQRFLPPPRTNRNTETREMQELRLRRPNYDNTCLARIDQLLSPEQSKAFFDYAQEASGELNGYYDRIIVHEFPKVIKAARTMQLSGNAVARERLIDAAESLATYLKPDHDALEKLIKSNQKSTRKEFKEYRPALNWLNDVMDVLNREVIEQDVPVTTQARLR